MGHYKDLSEEIILPTTVIQYRRNPDFIFRKIVEETILVPVHKDVAEMDHIYVLNELGAFLWERLDSPKTLAELARLVLDEFAVSAQTAHSDLETFIADMAAIGAVETV